MLQTFSNFSLALLFLLIFWMADNIKTDRYLLIQIGLRFSNDSWVLCPRICFNDKVHSYDMLWYIYGKSFWSHAKCLSQALIGKIQWGLTLCPHCPLRLEPEMSHGGSFQGAVMPSWLYRTRVELISLWKLCHGSVQRNGAAAWCCTCLEVPL